MLARGKITPWIQLHIMPRGAISALMLSYDPAWHCQPVQHRCGDDIIGHLCGSLVADVA